MKQAGRPVHTKASSHFLPAAQAQRHTLRAAHSMQQHPQTVSCRQLHPCPCSQPRRACAARCAGSTGAEDSRALRQQQSLNPAPLVPADSTGVSALRECAGSTSPLGEDLHSLMQFEAYESRLGSPEPVDSAFKVGPFCVCVKLYISCLLDSLHSEKVVACYAQQGNCSKFLHTGSTA